MLLVDCLAPNISGLLEDIYDRYGNRVRHVGGGAGYHDLRSAPVIFADDTLHPHAALMIVMQHSLTVGVRHGWNRVAGPFAVSRTRGRNVIQEIW